MTLRFVTVLILSFCVSGFEAMAWEGGVVGNYVNSINDGNVEIGTIINDDSPLVELSVSTNTGTEAGTTAITLTATASQAVSGDQTVDLGVSGTGITGTDYTLSNTTITILNGQTTGTVTFTVQNDAEIEGAETATLTISNPSAGLTLGAITTENIALGDDDFPSITYGGTGFDEVVANDGSVTGSITATLTGDAFKNTLAVGTDVTLGNIPAGLTPSVMVETTAQSWTVRTAASNNRWFSVTYGNGLFVAVARIGTHRVMTSPDGINWTSRTAAANSVWQSVTYGNGLFVAVSRSGTHRVMTSPDGITWTARVAAGDGEWYSVTYGNGLFVAVSTYGTHRVMTSPDGIIWTARTAAEDNSWISVTYGNGLFVAVSRGGTHRVMTSPDGITWTARTAAVNNLWLSITYGNGLFVAVARTGTNRVMTSPDGVTWTAVVTAGTNGLWNSVTYGNGLFVAVSFNGTNRVMTSNGEIAILSLTGNANPHTNAQEVMDITFDFANSAFVGGNASSVTNATGPASSNLGVDFDDPTLVNLSLSANAGTEADGTAITVTATASRAVSGNQTVDIGVSGTGITVTDYALSNTSITILDGQTMATVTFMVQDDTDIEGAETATLTISNPSTSLTLGTTTSQNITITDNDFPAVELSVSANTGTEAGATAITVSATASQAVSGDQTIDLGVSGTDITGTDYTLSNTTITILDGQAKGTVTFTIQDDADIEGPENATLTISNPSAGLTLGTTASQNVTITDNDFPSITYGGAGFDEVLANDGSVTGSITATLAGDTFKNTLNVGAGVTLGSVPAGLIPSVTVEKAAQSWTGGTVAANEFWGSIVYGNGLFVAVGLANIIMTSPDGTNWTARTAAADNWWTSVTYGNGLFVAVATNGTNQVMTSPDGINWTARTAAADNWWTSVTYGNGLFVAVSLDGTDRVMTSPDGINWTARTAAENNVWLSVTYGNGLFVALAFDGTNRVMTSPDGINWTARTAAENNSWQSVTYGNGLFVAVSRNGTNRVMTSPDGITWTARTAAADNEWFRVSYGNDLFVAVSWTGTDRLMTSSANDMAILSLTGNGNPHTNAEDVSDITFDFANSAFTGGSATNIINATGPASSNLGVDFDDPTLVNLSLSANAGTEVDGTAITVTATASQAVSGDQVVDVGVSGTGITVTDYALSNTSITILDGQTLATVTFMVKDDADIEGAETATLTISNPSTSLTLGTTTSQNITITDNDFPAVELSVSANTGTEVGMTAITVSATASQAVLGDQTIDLGVSGTDITGTDYTLSNTTITILDGQAKGTVTFTIQDDADIEGPENATLTISNPSAGLTLGTTASQNVTITDNDFPSITYGGAGFDEVLANDGSVTGSITATLAGDTFKNTLNVGAGVTLGNIPVGLTPSVTVETTAQSWTGRSAAANNAWVSVAYGNGLFVAVAVNGTNRVMTSPDGTTWTERTASADSRWSSVTYGNGLFVAVASNGTNRLMTSPDGITWTARTAAADNSWTSVTYGNGLFVAVSDDGRNNVVMTSPDGINWTGRNAVNDFWASVTYGNGLFVAVGFETIITSSDGINWILRGIDEVGEKWRSVTYGDGVFVAVSNDGASRVMTSRNGSDWTARTAAENNDWRSVAYGNGLFVAVSDDGTNRVMTSPDGITWTARTAAANRGWLSVAYGNGLFVAVAGSGTDRVMTSAVENIATLTLTGNTTTHTNAEDVSDITFDFANSAFVGGNASSVTNATGPASSNLGVDFDDPTLVNLSLSANAGAEAAGTAITVTATASQAVTGDQTVDLGVIGIGITGTDYTLSNSTITILDGQTLATVTFMVKDDADIEGAETATLTISNPSTSLTLGTTTSQNITITDNDFPAVELSVSANTGTEVGMTAITVSATASQAVLGDQTIDLGVSGTDITGTDYTLSNTTITILDGQAKGTVTFTIQDDADIEGPENATLTISNPSAGLTLGANTSEDITITDNDFPTLELSVSANAGTEVDGTVITVTATASQAVSGDQMVDLGVSGTDITGTDYTLSNTTITILDGQTKGTVTFTIQDDSDVEGPETATLTISNPSAGLTLGTNTSEDITITDNDFPSVELSVSANAGTEADGTVITVTATASQAVSGDQTVDLGVSGTGIANTDYTLNNATITILDGTTSGTVTLTVQDDADVEGPETATLTISNPSAGLTLGATTTQSIAITDNDFPTVELSVSANAGTEADQTVITVTATASQAVTGDQTVDLTVTGAGITGSDFNLDNATITILNGQTTGTVTFTIQDDADVEGPETAMFTISNPSAGLTLGATTIENVAIADDDFPTVELSVFADTGTEATGTAITVTATASQAVSGDQTVDLGVSGTGIADTDYMLNNATITILDGATSGTVTFTVQDDADIERTETASLTISNPSAGLTLGTNTSEDITIIDNDFPTVELSVSANAGTEVDGTVITVTATASQAVSGDQTADLGVSGTGIANTDYTLNHATITILDGTTSGIVTFTVQDDADIEGTETASLTISNPSAGLSLGANTSEDVTITDDDFPTVELSVSANTGTEAAGTAITVTATASQAVSGDQTVDLGVSGTDISGTDYTLSNTTITILDGQTTGTVTFTIQDDADIEGTETASLTISNPSAGLTLGATTTQSIAITDNDFPSVELSVSANAGTEADGTVITVTATASQAVSGDQTVDLGVSGTGIANTDYTLNHATITILDGQTTGTVTFTIQDDADIEGTETASLTISNPSAGLTLGATTTQSIAITDNDFPSVELSVSANAGTEADGTVITVTATASQAVSGDQTVDLGVSGTGIANTDYTLNHATITILDGATSGIVTFTVQDDADIEGTETASLTISNPSAGLTLGANTSEDIAITDNDFPTVELSVSANAGTEVDGTMITVTATASQAVSGEQMVDLGVSGADLTGTDYTLSGTTITIGDGQTTGSVTFTIQDDALIEGTEMATLTISSPSAGLTLGANTSEDIAITDNDFPTVELSVSANAGTEVDGTVITVTATASQAVSGEQMVDLGVSGADLTGTDYTLSGTTITIGDGQTTGSVTFTIQDDALIEGTEMATLTISSPSAGLTLGANTSEDIAITDNDFPTVELSVSANTGTEADQTVITVTATASQIVNGDQTVDLAVTGAGITGSDFNLDNATITILNGQTTGTVTFTIQDDADVEGVETAIFTISNPSAGLTLGANTSEDITITDNDFPTLELSVSANAGTEVDGTVITVTATASQAVSGDQTVDLAVTGAGITGSDFNLDNATITILDGQTKGTVTFTIQDDSDVEGPETATLTISNPSAGLTLGATTTQNVAITDNDFPKVELNVSTNTGSEAAGTVITVTATTPRAVSGDQTVDLAITGTGITGTDYTLSNTTITILDGQTMGTVTFTVQGDADVEGPETATLTISNPSAGLTLGATTTQNVVITDNDEVEPDLINTTITASTLSLVADGVTASVITVQLIDSDGNALMVSRGMVTLNVTGSALLTAVSDNGDGSYTAMLTNTVAERVMVSGQWDGLNISAEVEVEFTPDNTDTDVDGIFDRLEDLNMNGDLEDDDTDRDGIPNYLDTDDDGDSIPTRDEDVDGDGDPQNDDTDQDQIPNYLDDDDDDDGIPTIDEDANGNLNLFDDDTDGDGILNFLDPIENMVVDKLLSPNGDGINDILQIRDAGKYPNNKVSIFNRNGNLIFEIEGYDNRDRLWNGIPNRGLLASGDKTVPNGTYFYVIDPNDGSETITGFFVVKR